MHPARRLWSWFGILIISLVLGNSQLAAADKKADSGPPRKAQTYHVSATTGDDTHDGLTPAMAWRSLQRVNQAVLKPGDKVLFRRGDTWRSQLVPQSGSADGPITYGAYGEGAKPLFLGSVALNRPQDWQQVEPGIWATVPLTAQPREILANLGQTHWSLHQEGGAACVVKASTIGTEKNREYVLECQKAGSQSNHLQFTVPGLRVRAGEYYQLTYRARCAKSFTPVGISIMKSGPPWTTYASPAKKLVPIGPEWEEGTVYFHAHQSADNARLTVYLGEVLPAGATLHWQPGVLRRVECNQSEPLSVDVGNIIFDEGAKVGVKKWKRADLRRDGDFCYDGGRWQVLVRSDINPAQRHRSIELALTRHIINEGGRKFVTYENLDLRYGAAHGIGGGSTHHITVRDCDFLYIGGGHQFTRPDGHPVRYGNGIEFWADAHDCLVEGCRLGEIYDAALTNQGDGVNVQENITYRRNVIWNSEYSFEYWNRGEKSRTRNIVFEHNTCVNAGFGWGHQQRPDPNGRHLMFYDNSAATEAVIVRYNIFCNATDSCLRLHGRDWTKTLTLDHNCWFQAKGPILLWINEKVAPEQFAAFQKQQGFDAHSLVADPKLVDPGRQDFRLAPDSPARSIQDQGQPTGALP